MRSMNAVCISMTLCLFRFSFEATDAQTIKSLIAQPKSKSVYVILAQALNEKIPPFILQIFGSNSTWKACDVVQRWHYTKQELRK